MARVCVFDVNETLLDLAALDHHFERVFGDASVRRLWFARFIQSALVATVTDAYRDFATTGAAALAMVAAQRGVSLSDDDRDTIIGAMETLPPHPDVIPAFEQLQAAGLRLASLTNSTAAVAHAQLNNAGLAPYLEQMLSADSVQRLKPAREPYIYASERLGVSIGQIRLVACHAWDIAGALRAGAAAAFVARSGMVLDPLVPRPDVVGSDMQDVARQIIAAETTA